MARTKMLPVRGYLIHLTHYDPTWFRKKPREKPFDLDVALEVVDALAAERFNLLVIDCADGVRYRSHPELAKRYTAPMRHLTALVEAARDRGLEVVPKLNFSRSYWHHHNDWILGPGERWSHHFDDDAYWKKAFRIIDELIAVCRPKRFFHIGMDEDHDRAYSQYAAAIKTLHDGLKTRKLRTLIWNDSGIAYGSGLIHAEKSLSAEKVIPRDVVQVLWQYSRVPTGDIRRIRRAGFELWGAPGSRDPAQTAGFRDAVIASGGKGLLMTAWIPCRAANRKTLLDRIAAMGPIYRGE
jgi:hypothetical protein